MVQGKTPIGAGGGAIDDVLGTSTDKILAAIQSVDGPDGVLVLLDLGSAILSAEMALEMLSDEQRERIRLSYAPLVEGAVAAALEASLGRTLAQVQQVAEKTANVDQLQLLKPLTLEENVPVESLEPPANITPGETLELQLTLANPAGLHARPASLFVQTAARFQANIRASGHGRETDATSIIGVLSLGMRQGDTITIRASGADAKAAIEALSELVRVNFYETAPEIETTAPTSQDEADATAPVEHVPQQQGASWRGIKTSAGVAVGPALLYTSGTITLSAVEKHPISSDEADSEQQRLREALNGAAQELRSLSSNLQSSVGQANAAIFDAQALMLLDPGLLESALHMIESEHIGAAGALATTAERYASTLETLDDPLLAARAVDMRDAVSRAIGQLTDHVAPGQALSSFIQPLLLVANGLTPCDTDH